MGKELLDRRDHEPSPFQAPEAVVQDHDTIRTEIHDLVLSVVIPALNEEGYIENILTDLTQNSYDPNKFEVIVSDSGSIDRTREIVNQFTQKYPQLKIRLVGAKEKGVAQARNAGADQAKGEYLLFFDADTRISKTLLENVVAEMKERDLDVAAFYLVPNSSRLDDKALFALGNVLVNGPLQHTDHPSSIGAGIMAKRKLHQQLEGFDESLSFGEDVDYGKRGKTLGKFGLFLSEKILFSVRRLDKEGRLKVWPKALVGLICYLLDIKQVPFQYEFGKFSKGNDSK